MRLLFILDDTSFYHPQFLGDLVKKLSKDKIYLGLVKKIPKKNNLSIYLLKSFYLLKINEVFKLLFYAINNKIKSFLFNGKKFHSMKNVINYYNLNHFYIYDSINKIEYLKKIEALNPDVIISSNSLYFGKRLLSIPSKCCINRHSSLLPSYGGLWPVFQAIRCGEKNVGVTIHVMIDKIDKGLILAQERVKVEKNETVSDVYEKCFNVSVDLIIEAINKIKDNNLKSVTNNFEESYYSFPKKSHWDDLRKLNKKFI